MDNKDIMSIYDRLCMALTAYEADTQDPEYDKGQALYEDLVDIVSDFAIMLN